MNIIIEAEKIRSAAETLSNRSGYEETPITIIEKALRNHIEELTEEMLYDPEWFFKTDHRIWRDIDKEETEMEEKRAA